MNTCKACQLFSHNWVLQPFLRIRTSRCSPSPSGSKPRSSSTIKSSGLALSLPVDRGSPYNQVRRDISIELFSTASVLDQQGYGLAGNTFATAGETQLFSCRGFYVHVIHMTLQIFGQEYPHLRNVRCHFWGLRNDRDIQITKRIPFGANTAIGFAQ